MKKSNNNSKILIIIILSITLISGGIWYIHNQTVQNSIRITKEEKIKLQKKLAKTKEIEAEHLQKDPIYKAYKNYGLTYKMTQKAKNLPITAIGDSVMLGSAYGLREIFPQIKIDATVSRQAYQGVELIEVAKQSNTLENTIIIGLGTNGTITNNDIKNIMQVIGKKRQIYWISVNVNQPWETGNNNKLKLASKRYSNFHIIDWKKLTKDKSDSSWFSEDGIHPSVKGQEYYYTFIAQEILK